MAHPAAKPTILIVEDEFLIRLAVSETLMDAGFEVLEAETVDEALAHLSSQVVSLLLTDLRLQNEGDGIRLAETAREMTPTLPIIYMTGMSVSPDSQNLGPNETMIAKPFLPSELTALARRLLAGG